MLTHRDILSTKKGKIVPRLANSLREESVTLSPSPSSGPALSKGDRMKAEILRFTQDDNL